jgi:hypothetical protein
MSRHCSATHFENCCILSTLILSPIRQAILDLALIFGDAILAADKCAAVKLLLSIIQPDATTEHELMAAFVAIAAEGCAKLLFARRLRLTPTTTTNTVNTTSDSADDDDSGDDSSCSGSGSVSGSVAAVVPARYAVEALAMLLFMYFAPGSPADPATLALMVQQEVTSTIILLKYTC